MRPAPVFAAVFQSIALLAVARPCAAAEEGFTSLFDGKTLEGWTVNCLPKDRKQAATAWTVDRGTILANTIGHPEHFYIMLATQKESGDFVLRLRIQVERGVRGNSGIQIRSRYNAQTGWMEGPQIDINPPDPQTTGKLWNEGPGPHRWLSNEPVKGFKFFYADEGPGWNDMEITAEGTKIRSVLNGVTVVDYDGSGVLDDELHKKINVGIKGMIGLQIHSNDELKLRFKDIRIKELPPDAMHGLIVFSSNRSGPWRIWTVRPDGTAMRELTKGAAEEHDVDPVFSPDGKRILFSSTRGKTIGVWKMAVDGSQLERIFDGDQAEWSPDGKSIALRRKEALWTRHLATGQEKRISPESWAHPSGPAWSPDGTRIACACRWEAGNALFLLPSAGGEPVKIYDREGACEPHWSPDGKRLVYETETHLAAIDPDGKKNRLLTYFGGVQRYGRFSPDGKWIVFCQGATERGPWELYRIPAAGGTPVKLTEGASDMNPDWRMNTDLK